MVTGNLLIYLGIALTVFMLTLGAMYAYAIRKAREQGEDIRIEWKPWK